MTSNKKPEHEYSKWTKEGTVTCFSGFAVPRNGEHFSQSLLPKSELSVDFNSIQCDGD